MRSIVACIYGGINSTSLSHRIIDYIALILFLSAVSSTAIAANFSDDSSVATEETFLTELPTVITATRLKQPIADTPVAMTIIDRELIESSGALDVPELLRLVPGFQVAAANGNVYSATYHGFATAWPNRMQVLIDGRSVYTPLFSIIDWNHLGVTIDDIERIEVVRGTDSPAYGSNAFRGTVNIITRQPFQDVGFTARATTGAIHTRRAFLRYATANKKFDSRISYDFLEDTGFPNVDDNKRLQHVSLRSTATIDLQDTLDFQAGGGEGPVGAWGEAGSLDNPIRDKQTRSYFVFGRWNRTLPQGNNLLVQVFHNYLDWNDRYTIDLPSPINETIGYALYSGTATRSELEIQHTFHFDSSWRTVWGVTLRRDRLRDDIILGQPGFTNNDTQLLFANMEWLPSPAWVANFGAMLEHNDIIGFYSSPRIALNHHLTQNQTVRFAITRSSRTPSLYEYYNNNDARLNDGTVLDARYHSSPNLGAETVRSYEVGYLASIDEPDINFDLKLFRDEFRDLIQNVGDPTYPDLTGDGSWIWLNAGYLNISGAEFQLRYHPRERTLLTVQYSYAVGDGKLLRRINPDQTYDEWHRNNLFLGDYEAATIPRHTLSALISNTFHRNVKASLFYWYTDEMIWRGDGDFIDAVSRLDARIGKQWEWPRSSFELAVIAHNILNDYYDFNEDNVFSSRYFVQASLRY